MSLEEFDAHLHDPAPGFRCYACGDRSEKPTLLARIENDIGQPASRKSIATADKICDPASPVLKHFVELHDGILLYRDTKSEAAGIEFFKAAEWQSRTEEMRESMTAMGFEDDDMPEWFHEGVVFGEIPHSGNYFVIQTSGNAAGQVFYCDHDDFQTEAIAASFEELLSMIVADPPGLLYRCGCFMRYSDGKTDIQWIPKEYVSDCGGN